MQLAIKSFVGAALMANAVAGLTLPTAVPSVPTAAIPTAQISSIASVFESQLSSALPVPTGSVGVPATSLNSAVFSSEIQSAIQDFISAIQAESTSSLDTSSASSLLSSRAIPTSYTIPIPIVKALNSFNATLSSLLSSFNYTSASTLVPSASSLSLPSSELPSGSLSIPASSFSFKKRQALPSVSGLPVSGLPKASNLTGAAALPFSLTSLLSVLNGTVTSLLGAYNTTSPFSLIPLPSTSASSLPVPAALPGLSKRQSLDSGLPDFSNATDFAFPLTELVTLFNSTIATLLGGFNVTDYSTLIPTADVPTTKSTGLFGLLNLIPTSGSVSDLPTSDLPTSDLSSALPIKKRQEDNPFAGFPGALNELLAAYNRTLHFIFEGFNVTDAPEFVPSSLPSSSISSLIPSLPSASDLSPSSLPSQITVTFS